MHLTLSDRAAHTLSALPRVQVLALLALNDLGTLLHDLGALGEDELDVAGVRPDIVSVLPTIIYRKVLGYTHM